MSGGKLADPVRPIRVPNDERYAPIDPVPGTSKRPQIDLRNTDDRLQERRQMLREIAESAALFGAVTILIVLGSLFGRL